MSRDRKLLNGIYEIHLRQIGLHARETHILFKYDDAVDST